MAALGCNPLVAVCERGESNLKLQLPPARRGQLVPWSVSQARVLFFWYSPIRQLSGKQIDDHQPIDPPAGLKVLGQEPIAPCLQDRRDDQRIVEAGSAGWFRETPSSAVRFLAVEREPFRHRPCTGAHPLDDALTSTAPSPA